MYFLKVIFVCILYAAFNVSGAALIKGELLGKKLGSFKDYFPLLKNFKVIAGFSLAFISALILFKALSMSKFSLVIPIANGVNFLITVLVGLIIFNDKIGLIQIIGLSLIISGIILISLIEGKA